MIRSTAASTVPHKLHPFSLGQTLTVPKNIANKHRIGYVITNLLYDGLLASKRIKFNLNNTIQLGRYGQKLNSLELFNVAQTPNFFKIRREVSETEIQSCLRT